MLMRVANDITTVYKTPFQTVMQVIPQESHALPNGVIPAIRLSSATAGSFIKEFRRIDSRPDQFLICVEEEYPGDDLCKLLIHSLFSTNYLFINNKPVLLVGSGLSASAAEKLMNHLTAVLVLQGYPELVFWHVVQVERDLTNSERPVFVDTDTGIGIDWLKNHLFKDLSALTSYVILDFSTKEEGVEKHESIDQACKTFLSGQPLLANSLGEYLTLKNIVAKLSSEHAEIKQRFSGAEKTIEVIRTKYKDDYENLFKWYHNEYEILPLWYKRFGHVLKVIMGKRSFRSLFSDDVKKYKN